MKIGSVEINLFTDSGHNDPWATERMVEIPLALWFVNKHNHKILEIGAVTPYYSAVKHEVIDPYDPHPVCIKKQINELTYENKNVLCISTIEHVSHGEYFQEKDIKKTNDALNAIRKSSSYLVTWPVGWNVELDDSVNGSDDLVMLKRLAFQEWSVVSNLLDVQYMKPWHCGNGLYVVTNCRELY